MNLKPSEHQIQSAILEYLNARGHMVWRNNTGMFSGEYKGKKRFIRAGVKGSADILGLQKDTGVFLAIEVKRAGGTVTPEQFEFLNEINRRHGRAFVAYSVEDVINHGL